MEGTHMHHIKIVQQTGKEQLNRHQCIIISNDGEYPDY